VSKGALLRQKEFVAHDSLFVGERKKCGRERLWLAVVFAHPQAPGFSFLVFIGVAICAGRHPDSLNVFISH